MTQSRPQRAVLTGISWYQHATAHRLSPCRYIPSCSSYALEAVEVHGAARGTWLAVRRLCRCRPFGGSGVDPVPAATGASRSRPPLPAADARPLVGRERRS